MHFYVASGCLMGGGHPFFKIKIVRLFNAESAQILNSGFSQYAKNELLLYTFLNKYK